MTRLPEAILAEQAAGEPLTSAWLKAWPASEADERARISAQIIHSSAASEYEWSVETAIRSADLASAASGGWIGEQRPAGERWVAARRC